MGDITYNIFGIGESNNVYQMTNNNLQPITLQRKLQKIFTENTEYIYAIDLDGNFIYQQKPFIEGNWSMTSQSAIDITSDDKNVYIIDKNNKILYAPISLKGGFESFNDNGYYKYNHIYTNKNIKLLIVIGKLSTKDCDYTKNKLMYQSKEILLNNNKTNSDNKILFNIYDTTENSGYFNPESITGNGTKSIVVSTVDKNLYTITVSGITLLTNNQSKLKNISNPLLTDNELWGIKKDQIWGTQDESIPINYFPLKRQASNVNSIENCQAKCENNDECQSYIYSENNNRCFLLHNSGNENLKSSSEYTYGYKTFNKTGNLVKCPLQCKSNDDFIDGGLKNISYASVSPINTVTNSLIAGEWRPNTNVIDSNSQLCTTYMNTNITKDDCQKEIESNPNYLYGKYNLTTNQCSGCSSYANFKHEYDLNKPLNTVFKKKVYIYPTTKEMIYTKDEANKLCKSNEKRLCSKNEIVKNKIGGNGAQVFGWVKNSHYPLSYVGYNQSIKAGNNIIRGNTTDFAIINDKNAKAVAYCCNVDDKKIKEDFIGSSFESNSEKRRFYWVFSILLIILFLIICKSLIR